MVTVVTGANRGIGAALVAELARGGQTVRGCARVPGPGQIPLDVTDAESVAGLGRALDGQPVDLLVCNAGVYLDRHEGLSDGYSPDLWARSFAVNVTGVFLCVQTLLPHLQQAANATGLARIAIISSQMGSTQRAPGGSYIYRASKAAAVNLGRNLATDLRDLGIAVGVYHPGWVRTDMGGGAAEIDVGESASGLAARFGELDLASTGCFRTWDGRDHPI